MYLGLGLDFKVRFHGLFLGFKVQSLVFGLDEGRRFGL